MAENNEGVWQKPITQTFKIYADRMMPEQPIKYDTFHTHIAPRFNLRKLALLPIHLANANMIQGFNRYKYFIFPIHASSS